MTSKRLPMRRRDFLLGGVAAGAVVAGGVIVPLAFIFNDEDIATDVDGVKIDFFPRTRVASLADLQGGEPVFFDYPLLGQSNILVDLGERAVGGIGENRSVVAFSNLCTHMGCPITDYQPDHRVLGPCVCHYTTFDLAKDGQVVLGQGTQNLPRVLLETEGDEIFASGLFRLVYGFHDNLDGVAVEIVGGA